MNYVGPNIDLYNTDSLKLQLPMSTNCNVFIHKHTVTGLALEIGYCVLPLTTNVFLQTPSLPHLLFKQGPFLCKGTSVFDRFKLVGDGYLGLRSKNTLGYMQLVKHTSYIINPQWDSVNLFKVIKGFNFGIFV